MLHSGLLLLEANLNYPVGSSFNTITKDLIGNTWNIISGITVAFVLYILTYAYISANGAIISETISMNLGYHANPRIVGICTAIFVASKLAPELLGAIAVAAYSYMALVPIIQPPIMRALTTKKERMIVMEQLRPVSKLEKIMFPIICTIIICLILPTAVPLVGMLMLGNLMKESGVVDRINKTAGNELMNIITIFLGVSVGCTTNAETFLNKNTLFIVALGLIAFCFGTAGGVLFGKIMCWATHGKVNPLIGSAGVSAVPMAARVSQKVGQQENPQNFLLMHAMGPNVAGVIGSAVAAGILINMLK